jgi:hypothetical protein
VNVSWVVGILILVALIFICVALMGGDFARLGGTPTQRKRMPTEVPAQPKTVERLEYEASLRTMNTLTFRASGANETECLGAIGVKILSFSESDEWVVGAIEFSEELIETDDGDPVLVWVGEAHAVRLTGQVPWA